MLYAWPAIVLAENRYCWRSDLGLTPPNSYSPSLVTMSWILSMSYFLITVLLAGRFLFHLTKVMSLARYHVMVEKEGVKLILVPGLNQPFASFNYVFLNDTDYLNHRIPIEILRHEIAHVKQKHTWDLILINTMTIFFWFNPLIYLFRRAIQLNHEYLADESVLKSTTSIYHYQNLILNQIQQRSQTLTVSSSFSHYSSTKNRLLMMGKATSRKKIFRNKLVIAPLFLFLLLFFGNAAQAQQSISSFHQNESLYTRPPESTSTISKSFLVNWRWFSNSNTPNKTITTFPKRDSLYRGPRSLPLDSIYDSREDTH